MKSIDGRFVVGCEMNAFGADFSPGVQRNDVMLGPGRAQILGAAFLGDRRQPPAIFVKPRRCRHIGDVIVDTT
jgi:hypothetical protein